MSVLRQFFISCFHQDWDLDFETYADAVRDYARHARSENRRQVADQLSQLLRSRSDVTGVIAAHGGNLRAAAMGMNERQLLESILAILQEEEDDGKEPP